MVVSNAPRVSVVMVDGSFREFFHSIRFFADQTWAPEDFELLWVEYYDSVNPALQAEIGRYPNCRVITLDRPRSELYHSSFCFNKGIEESRGELILVPDADLVVEQDFIERVWAEHQTNDKLVMYMYRYDEPEESHEEPVALPHLRRVGKITNPSNFGGCLSVRKKWLLAINGYDQHPVFASGYHANGLDVNCRLKALGLHVMWHPELKMYHPWHPHPKGATELYRKQGVVVDYRARQVMSQAFQGIDATRNVPFPPQLEKRVVEMEAKQSTPQTSQRPSLADRIRYRISRKIHP
jgi:hypothetical protein